MYRIPIHGTSISVSQKSIIFAAFFLIDIQHGLQQTDPHREQAQRLGTDAACSISLHVFGDFYHRQRFL